MKEKLIKEIEQEMGSFLNNYQMQKLKEVLQHSFFNVEVMQNKDESIDEYNKSNQLLLDAFISAKKVEGCSEKSVKYYLSTLDAMLLTINKSIKQVVTDDIRHYLAKYKSKNNASKVTVDNVRRILSSFFCMVRK